MTHQTLMLLLLIIDGAAMVNILKPIAITTFEDYALKVFIPYLDRQLQNVSRLDIVWDQYLDNSLKAQTRMKRGKGVRPAQGCCTRTSVRKLAGIPKN